MSWRPAANSPPSSTPVASSRHLTCSKGQGTWCSWSGCSSGSRLRHASAAAAEAPTSGGHRASRSRARQASADQGPGLLLHHVEGSVWVAQAPSEQLSSTRPSAPAAHSPFGPSRQVDGTLPGASAVAAPSAPSAQAQIVEPWAEEGIDLHTQSVPLPQAWWAPQVAPEAQHDGQHNTGTNSLQHGVTHPQHQHGHGVQLQAQHGQLAGPACQGIAQAHDPCGHEQQLMLTGRIKACRSWRQLQEAYQATAPRFNAIHTATLLVALRRVVPSTLFPTASASTSAARGGGDAVPSTSGALDPQGFYAQPSGLGRRATRERREVLAFVQQVLVASVALLPQFGPYELTACLHTLAKMGLSPPRAWLKGVLQCSYPMLLSGQFNGDRLGLLVSSLATLRVTPPSQWMEAVCDTSERLMAQPEPYPKKGLVMLAWGLATLQQPVTDSWSSAFLLTLQRQVEAAGGAANPSSTGAEAAAPGATATHMPPSSATTTTTTTAAAAAVSSAPVSVAYGSPSSSSASHALTPPPSPFPLPVSRQERQDLAYLLSNCLWAAGTLQLRPSRAWAHHMAACCHALLPVCNSWEVSVMLWGLMAMQQPPPAACVSDMVAAVGQRMASADPEHLVRTLYCLACLGAQVQPRQQGQGQAGLAAGQHGTQGGRRAGSGERAAAGTGFNSGSGSDTRAVLASSAGQQARHVINGASHAGMPSEQRWLTGRTLEVMSAVVPPPAAATAAVGGLATAATATARGMAPMYAADASHSSSPHTRQQAGGVASLTRPQAPAERPGIGVPQQQQSYSSSGSQLPLPLLLPHGWVTRFFQQTHLQLFEFQGPSAPLCLWALARLKVKPPHDWLEVLLMALFERNLEGMQPRELAALAWSLARLHYRPHQAWLSLYWSVSGRSLRVMESRQLLQSLRAMAAIGATPPKRWLKEAERASLALLPQLSAEGSAVLLWSFALLDHCPGEDWVDAFFTSSEQALMRLPWARASDDRGEQGTRSSKPEGGADVAQHAGVPAAQGSSGRTEAEGQEGGAGGIWRAPSLRQGTLVGLALERLSCALARLQLPLPPSWEQAFLDAAHANMPHLRQGNLANLLYGLRIMGLQPGQEWVQRAVACGDALIARSSAASGQQVPRLESVGQPDEVGALSRAQYKALRLNLLSMQRLVWGVEPLSQDAHQRWQPVLQRLEQQAATAGHRKEAH